MANLYKNQNGLKQSSDNDIKSIKAIFKPSRNKEYAIFSLGDEEQRVYVGKYHDTDSFRKRVTDYFNEVEHCNLKNVKQEKKFLRRPVMSGQVSKIQEEKEDAF